MQPWCLDCGATEDLSTDHLVSAWERRDAGLPIRLVDVAVVCGPCNTRRGSSRATQTTGDEVKPTRRDRWGKAQRRSHTSFLSGNAP